MLSQLSRITSGGKVLPEVEGLRFIAIVTVIFHHLIGNILSNAHLPFLPVGRFGVMLFFSISGFILALPRAKQYLANGPEVSLRSYFIRRITRLEPPFLVNAFLLLPVALVLHPHALGEILASVTYTHQFFYHSNPIINGVTWSLELEIQFYILAPLLFQVYHLRPRWARHAILGLMILLAAICNTRYGDVAWYRTSVLYFIQYFLVGLVLADLYADFWRKRRRKKTWQWDIASVVGWALVGVLVFQTGTQGVDQVNPLVLVGIFLAYAGALRGRWSSKVLSFGYIPIIGGMCYTIYLYHYWAIIFVSHLTAHLIHGSFLAVAVVQSLVSLLLIAAVSVVMFVMVERPCMDKNWPEKLRARLYFVAVAPVEE